MIIMPSGWSDSLAKIIEGSAPEYYRLEYKLGSEQLQILVETINQGIDPYLEAIFFKPPVKKRGCLEVEVEKKSLHVLVRRLMESERPVAKEMAEAICGKIGIGFTDFWRLDPFLRTYITCAFWTWDEEESPSGCDYETTGCAEKLFKRLAPETLKAMKDDCDKFQRENAQLLANAGDDEQNGHDFWLTRGGYGAGFGDRGYPDEISKPLTEACREFGNCTIYTGDDGKIYLTS